MLFVLDFYNETGINAGRSEYQFLCGLALFVTQLVYLKFVFSCQTDWLT